MVISHNFWFQQKTYRLHKVVKCLIILICATICMYQVFQLLNQYFEYDIEVQTTIGNIEEVTLPTISICVAYKIYGKGGVPREIRNLLEHSAYDYNHRILSCTLVLQNGDKINCESVTKPEKFMTIDYVCHSLFTENKERLKDYHSKTFMVVDVNLTDTKEDVHIALYNRNQVDLNCDSIGFDYLHKVKHDVTSYSYTENSFHLLPSPFKSMCVEYNSIYNTSRRSLVERCAQQKFYNKSGDYCRYSRKCFSGGSFVSEKDLLYHLNYTEPDVHFEAKGRYQASAPSFERQFCFNQLEARECETREFAIRRIGTANSYEVKKQNRHRILLLKPILAGLDVQEFPLMSFEDALSAIAGILNLWSNMAFMDIANLVLSNAWVFVKTRFTKNESVKKGVWVGVEPILRRLKPRYSRRGKVLSLRRVCYSMKLKQTSNEGKLRLIITIVYCIGFVLCCGHIYNICNLYIEHPFQTEVRLLKKPTFNLKPLSICTALDMPPNSAFNQTLEYYVKRTKFVEMFHGIMRTNHYSKLCNILSVSSVITSKRKGRVCFTLFLGLRKCAPIAFNKILTEPFNKATLQDTYLLHMHINLKYSPNGVDLVLHNHDTDLDTSIAIGNQLTYQRPLNRTIQYRLSYLTYEKTLISDHYKSNCFDYKKLSFNDRDDAIRQCALKSFINQHHQLASNFLVSNSEKNLINMTFSHIDSYNDRKKCKMMFIKLDCFSSEIKLSQRYYKLVGNYGQLTYYGWIKFILLTPQAYMFYTFQTYRSSFLEFLGNIGGTIALWIGWSFYDFNKIAKIIINRFG